MRKINDVVSAYPERIEPAPANMKGIQGDFFIGVYKTKDTLIGILDISKVLEQEKDKHTVTT